MKPLALGLLFFMILPSAVAELAPLKPEEVQRLKSAFGSNPNGTPTDQKNWTNPEMKNPDWKNPELKNPDWKNPEMKSPAWQNPEMKNQEWKNPEMKNPEWKNPQW